VVCASDVGCSGPSEVSGSFFGCSAASFESFDDIGLDGIAVRRGAETGSGGGWDAGEVDSSGNAIVGCRLIDQPPRVIESVIGANAAGSRRVATENAGERSVALKPTAYSVEPSRHEVQTLKNPEQ
jgi:hypothetical protein